MALLELSLHNVLVANSSSLKSYLKTKRVVFVATRVLSQEDDAMEMIMSTISSKATHRGSADAIVQTLASTLKRLWVVYITWRMENIAITQLREMSDRELDDIGLTRCDIARAVTGTQRSRTHTLLPLRNRGSDNALLPSSYFGQL
jgi:uncharacterized protein YjiS (DUF1127 family)